MKGIGKGMGGFTLIEAMVAATIMSAAAVALLGLVSSSLANLRVIEEAHDYQRAGEEVMNRVLLLERLPLSGTAEGVLAHRPGAVWRVVVTPWSSAIVAGRPSDAVAKIDVTVDWPARSGRRKLMLEAVKTTSPSLPSGANSSFQQLLEAAMPQ
jgi:type II secretory pathway pseudopilin PulG